MDVRSAVRCVVLALTAGASAQQAVQWRVEDGGNGHWYRGVRAAGSLSWSSARETAEQMGGHLATATTAMECDFLHSLAADANLWLGRVGPWLGGHQDPSASGYQEPSGGWRWVTGEAWYSRWGPGEPNDVNGFENHLHFISHQCGTPIPGRHWNDINGAIGYGGCTPLPSSYVVEWSADCDQDGIVDHGQILNGSVNDVNGNGIPDTCDCPADINQDGTIDAEDLAAVLFAWGMSGGKAGGADVDRSGNVEGTDLAAVLAAWGACP